VKAIMMAMPPPPSLERGIREEVKALGPDLLHQLLALSLSKNE
jgi:hypothetical protein